MRTDSEIERLGWDALASSLKSDELTRFIALVKADRFDYTEWRKDLFEGMSIDEINQKASEFQVQNARQDS